MPDWESQLPCSLDTGCFQNPEWKARYAEYGSMSSPSLRLTGLHPPRLLWIKACQNTHPLPLLDPSPLDLCSSKTWDNSSEVGLINWLSRLSSAYSLFVIQLSTFIPLALTFDRKLIVIPYNFTWAESETLRGSKCRKGGNGHWSLHFVVLMNVGRGVCALSTKIFSIIETELISQKQPSQILSHNMMLKSW